MRSLNRQPLRWWALAIVAIAILVAHAAPLYYLAAHKSVSVFLIVGILGVVLIRHAGLLGTMFAAFRRHLQNRD